MHLFGLRSRAEADKIQPQPFLFMSLSIRRIAPEDIEHVISLMREFAAFENLSEYCTVTPERLSGAMFGPDAFVRGIIALDDEKPVAYTIFYPNFSSFRGERGMYLEDIYISPDHRRNNLGEILIKKIAKIASELGFERIDFQVLEWNAPAIGFYLKHGAEQNDDERHFKFSGDAFRVLAS